LEVFLAKQLNELDTLSYQAGNWPDSLLVQVAAIGARS